MLLSFDKICFKDFMNFSGIKMSLENFAKSVGVSESAKLCYPYELYQSVEELENVRFFPSYEDFENSLYFPTETHIKKMNEIIEKKMKEGVWKELLDVILSFNLSRASCEQFWCSLTSKFLISENSKKYFHLCPAKYLDSADYFIENCENMIDYLREYNLVDCRILSDAVKNHCEGFSKDFGVDLHKRLSLPGVAQEIAFRNYDETMNKIYSIPIPRIKEDIRKFLNGGICLVLHRLIKLNCSDPEVPKAARQASSGKEFKAIKQLDFNSLYPYAFEGDLPTGPGFYLKKIGNSFRLISMDKTGSNISLESLQWLEYVAREQNLTIQHGFSGGEIQIGKYKIDGYSKKDGKTYGFDYEGCRFHRCNNPDCKTQFIKSKAQNDAHRATYLRSVLDSYQTISGCAWKDKLKELRDDGYPLPRPQFCPYLFTPKITEQDVMTALSSDELFGFFSVDLMTPHEKQKEMMSFPPIFQKIEVSPEMVNPQMREGKWPRTVNTMTFNGKSLLLITSLIKFYLDLGLKSKK